MENLANDYQPSLTVPPTPLEETPSVSSPVSKRKFLFIPLILLLLTILSTAVFLLKKSPSPSLPATTPTSPSAIKEKPVSLQKTAIKNGASLSFSPETVNVSLGEEFTLDIVVNTADEESGGSDVVINFQPEKIEALEIVPGKIYPLYLRKKIDNIKGKIIISAGAIDDKQPTFKGKGKLATLKLKAKNSGKTNLLFEFMEKATHESNVLANKTSQDLLIKVENAEINIK